MNAEQGYSGCFSFGHAGVFINLQQLTGNDYEWQQIQFNAANSSSVYQNNAKVKPDTCKTNIVIKY